MRFGGYEKLPEKYRHLEPLHPFGADVAAFHVKFGLEYVGPIRYIPRDLAEFRERFLFEEIHELSSATDFEQELDAFIDIAYVAVGCVYLHGIDFDAEVRRSFLPHFGNHKMHKRNRPRPGMKAAEVKRLMMHLGEYLGNHYYEFDRSVDACTYLAVFCQQCVAHRGVDFAEAWKRVQAANMAKMRVERAADSKRGSGFDVIKPPGWTPPNHADLYEGYVQEA